MSLEQTSEESDTNFFTWRANAGLEVEGHGCHCYAAGKVMLQPFENLHSSSHGPAKAQFKWLVPSEDLEYIPVLYGFYVFVPLYFCIFVLFTPAYFKMSIFIFAFLTLGLTDPKGLFQPKQFYGSVALHSPQDLVYSAHCFLLTSLRLQPRTQWDLSAPSAALPRSASAQHLLLFPLAASICCSICTG